MSKKLSKEHFGLEGESRDAPNHPEKVNEENLRAVVRRDPVQSARTLALGLDVCENTSLKYMLISVEEVSRDLSENREQIC